MLRSNPHLIEINTRLFLYEMRKKYSPDITLSSVPDEEWLKLKHLGFDIVWLMGVWESSEASEIISRDEDNLRKFVSDFNLSLDNIKSSPYAVKNYKLDKYFGFEWELKALKEKLNSFGMKLFLDFISNHTAIDAVMTEECMECYVCGEHEDFVNNRELFFEKKVGDKIYYIAHGKDPNFPAWKDTAQLNYFNPKTREIMIDRLIKLSDLCDGVRCDMVMLTLNDVHESIWGWFLAKKGYKKPDTEFWHDAIQAVKNINPQFIFMAEVYWGLEWRLQQLGFDYTYDKIIYDRLRNTGAIEVKGHLRAEKLYQKRSVRFIDNHDEEPSLVVFREKPRALSAAVLISTIKGLRFYSDMQLKGIKFKIPVQISDFDLEKYEDIEIEKFYEKLLKIVDHPAFHGGEWELVEVLPVNEEDRTNNNLIAYKWTQMRTIKIVVINYSEQNSSGTLAISLKSKDNEVIMYEEFSEKFFSFSASDLSNGLKIENMSPYSFYIFDYEF